MEGLRIRHGPRGGLQRKGGARVYRPARGGGGRPCLSSPGISSRFLAWSWVVRDLVGGRAHGCVIVVAVIIVVFAFLGLFVSSPGVFSGKQVPREFRLSFVEGGPRSITPLVEAAPTGTPPGDGPVLS